MCRARRMIEHYAGLGMARKNIAKRIVHGYTSDYTTAPASRIGGINIRAGGVSPDGFQPVRCVDFMI